MLACSSMKAVKPATCTNRHLLKCESRVRGTHEYLLDTRLSIHMLHHLSYCSLALVGDGLLVAGGVEEEGRESIVLEPLHLVGRRIQLSCPSTIDIKRRQRRIAHSVRCGWR